MDEYTVSGRWQARDGWQTFEKRVAAENESVAVEYAYAEFGSKHGLKRTEIDIDGVEA